MRSERSQDAVAAVFESALGDGRVDADDHGVVGFVCMGMVDERVLVIVVVLEEVVTVFVVMTVFVFDQGVRVIQEVVRMVVDLLAAPDGEDAKEYRGKSLHEESTIQNRYARRAPTAFRPAAGRQLNTGCSRFPILIWAAAV